MRPSFINGHKQKHFDNKSIFQVEILPLKKKTKKKNKLNPILISEGDV